jgi:DNA helicase-4
MSNVIYTNAIGRILGLSQIKLNAGHLMTLKGEQEKDCYQLIGSNSFIERKNTIFGEKITLQLSGKPHTFRFLKSKDLEDFCDAFNEFVNEQINEYLIRVLTEFNMLVLKEFPRDSWMPQIKTLCSDLHETYSKHYQSWKPQLTKKQREKINRIVQLHPAKAGEVQTLHEEYQLERRSDFFDKVESNPLTGEQRLGVLRNNDRNMVLAAAGTGKTSVMVAKALDLIDRGLAEPSEILILAYNRAAANELQARLEEKAEGSGVTFESTPEISTFHALGLQILKQACVPTTLSVFADDPHKLTEWVAAWICEYIAEDPTRIFDMIELTSPPVNPFSFENAGEYEAYVRDNEFRTMNGEKVKGYQELLIANFLYMNQILYEYEAAYVSKRRIDIGFDYKPDFHISDTSIYIEHFGIDREGNTRADIDSKKYNASIKNKHELHKEFETTLVETFHYEWCESTLLTGLKNQLTELGVKCNPMNPDDIYKKLTEDGELPTWSNLMVKALQAIRIERLNYQQIEGRFIASEISQPQKYATLFNRLNESYVDELKHHNSIDFDDMIIRAVKAVEDDEYQPEWKYILVDEFQDISASRMDFVKALINKGPSPSLTVVGDDWQSIYRFSGGKLELTTRFEELVGPHSKTYLQKTFRYNNSIANTAGEFVMQNPKQEKKQIDTHTKVDESKVYLYDDHLGDKGGDVSRIVEIVESIKKHDPEASIAIIARYNNLLKDASNELKKAKLNQNTYFWSFHKSKGLEADYCILTGLSQGRKGFPSERRDDAMVESLLPALDDYPHSEERRLLYVGITRAKKACHIIASPTSPSDFVTELLSPIYDLNIQSPYFKAEYQKIFKCPNCKSGVLRMIEGPYSNFYVCSSGNACEVGRARVCDDCQSPSVDMRTHRVCQNNSCGKKTAICDKCGRPMKKRTGKYGDFWGCSGFGIKNDQCKNTAKKR